MRSQVERMDSEELRAIQDLEKDKFGSAASLSGDTLSSSGVAVWSGEASVTIASADRADAEGCSCRSAARPTAA